MRKRRGFGPSASPLNERLASVAALVPEHPACEEAGPDQGCAERHSPDQPLDHPTPRSVTSDALRGDRHRAREIGLRLFCARLDLGIHGLPRLSENPARLSPYRLRKLPIQAFVILQREQDEPKRVILPKTQRLLDSEELLALGRRRLAPKELLKACYCAFVSYER